MTARMSGATWRTINGLLTAGVLVVFLASCQRAERLRGQGPVSGPHVGLGWTSPRSQMEFVWVPSLDMWVGKYEVTNAEYRGGKPRHRTEGFGKYRLDGDRQPVVGVSFHNAVAYADWLTGKERAAGHLSDSLRYRLPTEEEFMAYAQCGDGREYPWGNGWPPEHGNYSGHESAWEHKIVGYGDGCPVSCDVEECWANPWGLHGVGGNVGEICAKDANASQAFGAWRGASWLDSQRDQLRCSFRMGNATASAGSVGLRLDSAVTTVVGFRLVLSR